MTYSNGASNGTSNGVSKKTNGAVKSVASANGADVFLDESITVLPNAPQLVPGLLQEVLSQGIAFSGNHDATARVKLLDAARSLANALETPKEAMLRYCWSQSTIYAAIETSVDLGLFAALSHDDSPKTASVLAEATGADPNLLARILKHLATHGVINETGPDEYSRTGFSTSLGMPRYSDAYECMTGCITGGVQALPAFLRQNGFQTPSDGKNCPFQLGYRTESHFFDYLRDNPKYASQFNNHMSAYHKGRPSWMDVGFFPVLDLVMQVKSDDVLLVDMGGSIGHDLSEFDRKWSQTPGRLVLQDLPEVLDQAPALPSRIEKMHHDFFTEQPVKGARAYYMHSVLHDWTDDNCRKILSNIVPAMERGFSKVLINENVIPDTNAYWETTSLDIIMMADFASQERTTRQWHNLVESVGLKIVKIWTAQRGVESLIECELA